MKEVLLSTAFLMGAAIAFAQSATPAQMQAGKAVYAKNCLSCHMVDGAGVPGLNPPLAKTDWVLGDKKRLINVVLLGLNDPIIVNGDEYANPMPAQPHLSDKDIADVLTYIRNSFGNKASVVTEAEVKAQRGKAGAVKPK
jgi:mono/diheme cytochrome c family protein